MKHICCKTKIKYPYKDIRKICQVIISGKKGGKREGEGEKVILDQVFREDLFEEVTFE